MARAFEIIERPTPRRDYDALVQMNKIQTTVIFSPRELEFVKLRYQDEKTLREVAVEMGVTLRMAKFYASAIYARLGIVQFEKVGSGTNTNIIRALKLLIAFGIVTTERTTT